MANYSNPLDQFRTHSHHFILTLANSTEAHRKMIDKDGFMSAVNGAGLGEKMDLGGEDSYLLVDTRRFSQFSITNFESTQMYGTGPAHNPSVATSLLTMKLIDTTGLTFFNFVLDTMQNKIQSTRASAFFMLAIIFVGHTDHDTTETVATCFIPMLLTQMGFEFTSSGSIFDLEFVETLGNPGHAIPGLIDLGDIKAISTEGKSNTVGGMVQALEDSLNVKSLRFFQKYTNKALEKAGAQEKNELAAGRKQVGKLVQYMITLPKEWENFAINTAGKSKNIEQQFLASKKSDATAKSLDKKVAEAAPHEVDAATKARDSYKSFSEEMAVQDAITLILESSQEYLMLGSQVNRLAGTAVVHKTVTDITSDHSSYVVHVDVMPFRAPKVTVDDKGVEKNVIESSSTVKRLGDGSIKNLIEYDYMFSGKNVDVLDLKIKFHPHLAAAALDADLDLGGTRFADNSKAGQKEKAVDAASNGLTKTEEFNPMLRPGEPIFVPLKTKDQRTNFVGSQTEGLSKEDALKNIKARQEHSSTLSLLHFVGSLDSAMTVRGNPNLFRKYADANSRGGIPAHTLPMSSEILKDLTTAGTEDFFNKNLKKVITGGKEAYFKANIKPKHDDVTTPGTDPLLNGSDIAVGPVYVKINIYAPNVDFAGNTIPGEKMFTNKFFYNGVYMIASITHTFDQGSFSHVMALIPQNITGDFSNSVSSGPSTTANKRVA